MEHLPINSNLQAPYPRDRFGPYQVPDLGKRPPPDHGFLQYATEHAIFVQGAYMVKLPSFADDLDGFFAHVQAWLYFGLIKEVFGSSARFEDFAGFSESGSRIIDSSRLRQYMSKWYKSMGQVTATQKRECLDRIAAPTKLAWKYCDQLDHIKVPQCPMHMMVLFSIRVLVSTIWEMMYLFSEETSTEESRNLNNDHRFSSDLVAWPHLPPSYVPVACLMAGCGWCSHEILRLLSTYNLGTVWCISRTHGGDIPGFDHGKCDAAPKCVARDVDLSTHRPRHLIEGCFCDAVGPDIDQVKLVLRDGKVPLIRCSVDRHGEIHFKVIRLTKPKRHFAFSHVWADGIVIPDENKVFGPQFRNLFDYLQKAWPEIRAERLWWLPGSKFLARRVLRRPKSFDLWFDIFCIPSARHPTSPSGQDPATMELRKKAIGRIYPIFAGAESVVVVDRSLTQLDSKRLSTIDMMGRIASCGWTTRCWTFSEASLAVRSILLFCIGDKLVRYDEINLALESAAVFKALDVVSRGVFRDITDTALLSFELAWRASQPLVSDLAAFRFIWNSLSSRSTSWPDDVWGIMATLLGYSGVEIMLLDERDRLPALLKPLPGVPALFLFRNLPRSCDAPAPTRWVPTRVMGNIQAFGPIAAFGPGGLVLAKSFEMKLLFSANILPSRTFSVGLAHERMSDLMTWHVTIHGYDMFRQHAKVGGQFCLVLNTSLGGRRGIGSNTRGIEGIGCCLQVTNIRPNTIVEADFLSSVSYTSSLEPCDFDAVFAGPTVIVNCNRDDWYQLKTRRRKHKLSPFLLHRLLYFIVPACYISVCLVIMIPLWIWYRRGRETALVLASCIVLLCLVPYLLVVIFHESFLFRNWFDSFMSEGTPQRWWKRIMPFW